MGFAVAHPTSRGSRIAQIRRDGQLQKAHAMAYNNPYAWTAVHIRMSGTCTTNHGRA